jgi:hypothetical protein
MGPHPLYLRSVNSFPTGAAARGVGAATIPGFEGAEMDRTQLIGLPGSRQLVHPQLTRPAPCKSVIPYFCYVTKLEIHCIDMSINASLKQLRIILLLPPPAHEVEFVYCKVMKRHLCKH